jgi:hypothetical protein
MTTTTRYFVTDGPLATTATSATETYFREGLAAGTGGVRVVHQDGSIDLIAGNRYLQPGTAIRAEVCEKMLQIIYLVLVIREYDDWATHTDISAIDYPLGA